MTYSKKKYLQFLKSCGVVAAGLTFYACNHDNDAFVNNHNNEKISPEEIIAIVNGKLEADFPNEDKEVILNFFKDNIEFFKKDDETINDFFSFINGDINELKKFVTGQEKLEDWNWKNLDLKRQQLKTEAAKIKAQEEALKAETEEIIKSQIAKTQIQLQTLQDKEKELKKEEEALKSQKEDLKNKENELKIRKKENTDTQKASKQKIKQLESSLKPQKTKTKTTKKKVSKDENREEVFIVHNVIPEDEGENETKDN